MHIHDSTPTTSKTLDFLYKWPTKVGSMSLRKLGEEQEACSILAIQDIIQVQEQLPFIIVSTMRTVKTRKVAEKEMEMQQTTSHLSLDHQLNNIQSKDNHHPIVFCDGDQPSQLH